MKIWILKTQASELFGGENPLSAMLQATELDVTRRFLEDSRTKTILAVCTGEWSNGRKTILTYDASKTLTTIKAVIRFQISGSPEKGTSSPRSCPTEEGVVIENRDDGRLVQKELQELWDNCAFSAELKTLTTNYAYVDGPDKRILAASSAQCTIQAGGSKSQQETLANAAFWRAHAL